MKQISILLFSFLLLNTGSYAQTKTTNYSFDKTQQRLTKDQLLKASQIKEWLVSTISLENMAMCTKKCQQYLSELPDDIEMENEEKPGTIARAFKKKWANEFDMMRIPGPHPLEGPGNGGCNRVYLKNVLYLGHTNSEFYFNTLICCDEDEQNYPLILKVIDYNGSYLIDDVMSQYKDDYLKPYLGQ